MEINDGLMVGTFGSSFSEIRIDFQQLSLISTDCYLFGSIQLVIVPLPLDTLYKIQHQ